MKVLILGMPRTGTQCKTPATSMSEEIILTYTPPLALADALIEVGISPIYHMREVGKNKHQAFWIEALEAKYEGKGQPYGREQFDKILGDFEVRSFPRNIPFLQLFYLGRARSIVCV
jgi:hypothetical protein